MFTCPNVRPCFAITALLSGFVPGLRHFLHSWLCGLAISVICFHLAPTSTSHLCTSASRFPACGECVLWLLHQCSTLASLQNPSRASCFGLPLLPTLPMLLHTVLPLHCSLQWPSAIVNLLSGCVFRGPARLRSTTFGSPCKRPSPSPWTLSVLQPFFHLQTLVQTFSHVSDTWQAFSIWQDSVGWDCWETNIWQLVIGTVDAELDSMVLTLPLPSHQVVASVCTELPCSIPRSFTSKSTCLVLSW